MQILKVTMQYRQQTHMVWTKISSKCVCIFFSLLFLVFFFFVISQYALRNWCLWDRISSKLTANAPQLPLIYFRTQLDAILFYCYQIVQKLTISIRSFIQYSLQLFASLISHECKRNNGINCIVLID